MTIIKKYRCDDGMEFDSEEKAKEYENLCADIASAMRPLGNQPSLSGEDFVQHDSSNCEAAKSSMLALARKMFDPNDYPVLLHPDKKIHPCSAIGRIIDDGGDLCLQRAWSRLARINWATYREFNQPYYARQGEKC